MGRREGREGTHGANRLARFRGGRDDRVYWKMKTYLWQPQSTSQLEHLRALPWHWKVVVPVRSLAKLESRSPRALKRRREKKSRSTLRRKRTNRRKRLES